MPGSTVRCYLREVERHIQVMVHERVVLLRVQQLQKGGGRVALVPTPPELVDLINKNQGVREASGLSYDFTTIHTRSKLKTLFIIGGSRRGVLPTGFNCQEH